ncbi:squalene epoxidase-domain-containing protein, partial [Lineolata rhizophorae]
LLSRSSIDFNCFCAEELLFVRTLLCCSWLCCKHRRAVTYLPPPRRIQPSLKALDGSRPKCIASSFLQPSQSRIPGLIILGDAMSMRHPLMGGGMTVVLNDVLHLRNLLSPCVVRDIADMDLVRKQMTIFYRHRKDLASTINVLAEALYGCLSKGTSKRVFRILSAR